MPTDPPSTMTCEERIAVLEGHVAQQRDWITALATLFDQHPESLKPDGLEGLGKDLAEAQQQIISGVAAFNAALAELNEGITTRQVRIVDAAGELRVLIGCDKAGGNLSITNARGKVVGWLSALPDRTGALAVADADGRVRGTLQVNDGGSGAVKLLASDGESEDFGPRPDPVEQD